MADNANRCEHCGKTFSAPHNLKKHLDKKVCQKATTSTEKKTDDTSCNSCGQAFSTKGNLKKHLEKDVCGQRKATTSNEIGLIKSHISMSYKASKVIHALSYISLKFNACQYIGHAESDLYPLIFNDSSNNKVSNNVEALVPKEPELILQSVLVETQNSPVFLPKKVYFHHENEIFDLSEHTKPPSTDFNVTEHKDLWEVSLISESPIKERKGPFKVDQVFQRKVARADLGNNNLAARNEPGDPVPMEIGQPQNNGGNEGNDDDPMDIPDLDIDPAPEPNPGGNPGNPGGGPPGGDPGGGPGGDPPDGEPDQDPEPNDDDVHMNMNDILDQIRFTRANGFRYFGYFYNGYGAMFVPDNVKLKDVRTQMNIAGSHCHQFTSLFHFPNIMTDDELVDLTGHSIARFNRAYQFFRPAFQRDRIMSFAAKLLCYLQKMRKNTPYRVLGIERNISGQTLCEMFWKLAEYQYRNDAACPHRNREVMGLPSPNEIMQTSIVEDPYILAIYAPLIPEGFQCAQYMYDHTYGYGPYFSCNQLQRDTHNEAKYKHLFKIGILCNFKGHVVNYSPLSASILPRNGDGNLAMIQLGKELAGEIPESLNSLLMHTENNRVVVLSYFDKAYGINQGNRDETLTMQEYYENGTPNSHYFSIIDKGDKVLDENLQYVENEVPDTERPQFTARESNTLRVTTKERGIIERTNASVKQYRILDSRIIDSHFFDPIYADDNMKSLPKFELLANNAFCLHNRNHPGYERCYPCPQGYTEAEFGENFRNRITLLNPFDPTEHINFLVELTPRHFPNNTRPGHWTNVNVFQTYLHRFPQLALENVCIVTHGSYQIENTRQYITDMRSKEVIDLLKSIDEPEIDWDNYDVLMASIPQDTSVFYYNHIPEPGGWIPERHGPWCPRRFAIMKIPSRHSGRAWHTVIIAYVTPELKELQPAGYENPFGFRNEGYKDIVGYACLSNKCKIGQRTAGCCSHVASAMVFMGMHAYDPTQFWTTYKAAHYVDVAHVKSLNREMFGVGPPEEGHEPEEGQEMA